MLKIEYMRKYFKREYASPVQHLSYVRRIFFMDLITLQQNIKVGIYSAVRIHTLHQAFGASIS